MNIKTCLDLDFMLSVCRGVGCVYPHEEQSYFINTNIGADYYVICKDGKFYCEYIPENIELMRGYKFDSPTLTILNSLAYRSLKDVQNRILTNRIDLYYYKEDLKRALEWYDDFVSVLLKSYK